MRGLIRARLPMALSGTVKRTGFIYVDRNTFGNGVGAHKIIVRLGQPETILLTSWLTLDLLTREIVVEALQDVCRRLTCTTAAS